MHKIKVDWENHTITIDDETYELLDASENYYLFKDKNGWQEIRKDGYFDYEK